LLAALEVENMEVLLVLLVKLIDRLFLRKIRLLGKVSD
jgi:hypothetical protein